MSLLVFSIFSAKFLLAVVTVAIATASATLPCHHLTIPSTGWHCPFANRWDPLEPPPSPVNSFPTRFWLAPTMGGVAVVVTATYLVRRPPCRSRRTLLQCFFGVRACSSRSLEHGSKHMSWSGPTQPIIYSTRFRLFWSIFLDT